MTEIYSSICGAIRSPDLTLPLPGSDDAPEIEVVVDRSPASSAPLHVEIGRARFWLNGERQIIVHPDPGADPGLVAMALVDQALPRVAGRRGYALHASAVVLDGGAHVFVGPSGAGKSTHAARLARCGALLLGDDSILIADDLVWPSYRQTRIWDGSLPLLDVAADGPRDALGKLELGPAHGIVLASEPALLERISLLGTRDRKLSLGEAVRTLAPQRFFLEREGPVERLARTIDFIERYGPLIEVPRT